MALRRPHRKSRHGCLECKRRRVKCDEARPVCSNCAKRHAECEYGSSSSLLWANEEAPGLGGLAQARPRASGSDSVQGDRDRDPLSSGLGSASASGSPGVSVSMSAGVSAGTDSLGLLGRLGDATSTPVPALNLHDLELMMQWCNATHRTLSRSERTDLVWRNCIPEEALSHPFLMHGILAVSALHLARTDCDPSRRAAYLNRAVAHQNQALALFRELLGDVNELNAKAMFAFASIVVVYTFGFPHTPDAQDPWTCIDDLYQVLVLTRGIQQVIRSPADYLSQTSFAPILHVEESSVPLPEDAAANINQLHEANEVCGARDTTHETEVYTATIDNISEMLSWVYGGMTASTIAGRWAIKLPARFMELLREHEPMALVMLAHYGVLLQSLRHRWCFDEWCVRVARAVWAILDDQWRPLVHWAMCAILGETYIERVMTQ
ncbi:hypothetical protein N7532_002355 [Penicillium argentinense]|uniref:Zn(2)-C6 fungal-type domain-containing protein n=1 Tax=Penicillium argentinense TaxID=1131581 RepID=A0A9W9KKJ2_9EURO|nr:uncharacterized protein N7532_002355 [Penicillium argentinense]KAJ5109710.1 hypothetical protein N7532_002355 [Penicillium argentinense]